MPYILDIATAVPGFPISKEALVKFYARALESEGIGPITKKLSFLLEKTKISRRYSCIPDFNAEERELYTGENYRQPVEKRMAVYREKIMPLAVDAIDKVLLKNKIKPADITHLITVSCTGLFAPGFEFLVAEHYGLQHAEKLALNFLGCYAAIKAVKHAHSIAKANPDACVLIISAELCSLHFYPSVADEDIVANLLFADGAAAAIVCGNESAWMDNKTVLNIDSIGSACIPNTADLMTWDISSSAFRMFLSKHLVKTIKDNIAPVVTNFLQNMNTETDYWAIHPGGVRIVEAVKDGLGLNDAHVEDSMIVLQQYGNMSSPTILFILNRILQKVRSAVPFECKNIFTCAFGPGLTVEMIHLSCVNAAHVINHNLITQKYGVRV